jgi:hypothetical protein
MSAEEYTTAPSCHAFARPQSAIAGGPGVHLTLRERGLIVEMILPLDEARKAHARLGSAIATFSLAEALACDLAGEFDPDRRVPDGNPATRQQERMYRAKLAVRLGLASDDIRTVFDLSEDELALLRAEVAGA